MPINNVSKISHDAAVLDGHGGPFTKQQQQQVIHDRQALAAAREAITGTDTETP